MAEGCLGSPSASLVAVLAAAGGTAVCVIVARNDGDWSGVPAVVSCAGAEDRLFSWSVSAALVVKSDSISCAATVNASVMALVTGSSAGARTKSRGAIRRACSAGWPVCIAGSIETGL